MTHLRTTFAANLCCVRHKICVWGCVNKTLIDFDRFALAELREERRWWLAPQTWTHTFVGVPNELTTRVRHTINEHDIVRYNNKPNYQQSTEILQPFVSEFTVKLSPSHNHATITTSNQEVKLHEHLPTYMRSHPRVGRQIAKSSHNTGADDLPSSPL